MVTFEEPEEIGASLYRLRWTSDQTIDESNPYRVFMDGIEVSRQVTETFDVQSDANFQPVIEVLDNASDQPTPAFPGYLVLGWKNVAEAAEYRIEKYNGSTWDEVATVAVDETNDWQTFGTGLIDDETTHQYRVIPIDTPGNDGTALSFTVLMVRYPDVPDVDFVYDGSGPKTVTIDAA